jgi:transcriptional regulator with XRE-family HTH domain
MSERSDFAQRLQAAMRRAGYEPRPVVLEREFNTRFWGPSVTLQAVRRWLRGEALPTQEKLQVLAEWLSLPPEELRYGERVRQSVRESRARWDSEVSHEEREVLEIFLNLPAPQRKALRDVILTYAKVYGQTPERDGPPGRP